MLYTELPKEYYNNFLQFQDLYQLVTQRLITTSEFARVRTLSFKFVREFKQLYYNKEPEYLSVCTVQIHYLLYLPQNIRDFGLPMHYAQWTLKRYLQIIKRLAKSTSKPYISLANNLLMWERALYTQ